MRTTIHKTPFVKFNPNSLLNHPRPMTEQQARELFREAMDMLKNWSDRHGRKKR